MHGRSNGGRDDGSKLSANYADGSNCANYSSYESLRSLRLFPRLNASATERREIREFKKPRKTRNRKHGDSGKVEDRYEEIRRENLGDAGGFEVPEAVHDTRGFVVKLSLHRSLVESGTPSRTRTACYTTPLYRVSQTSHYSRQ
ncbi:hypothetical protein G5I_04385 [Acromyrmex echinatior]|uniref:Uncharacterized protein n=1 Tax=Acromyrmex echinatior TaxID=103372 RepID=F4WFH6_ACREC|nr:hypothetical protein G5I_04385 [Acromyrmex echinatior]